MIKYILRPGFIDANGERVWVGAAALLKAYGVSADECVVEQPWVRQLKGSITVLTPGGALLEDTK